MKNFKIKIAELYVTISAKYSLTYEICRPYLTDMPWSDITVYVSPAQIKEKQRSLSVPITEEQAECICINEQISLKLLQHDAFLLHAAVVAHHGKAYAFCAPRGVGKTTHALLWQEHFGKDAAEIINGDKPIIRRHKDGTFYAYGTPWGGKEGLQKNCGVRLSSITFIERATQDRVCYVTEKEYLNRIISQVVFPPQAHTLGRGASLLAQFMRATPAAVAACTKSTSAVNAVYSFWNNK